jgi:hypothetical protein
MNKIALLVIFSVALALVAGVGANFRMFNAEREFSVAVVADDQELIDLTPNQPYAFIDDDGKMIVRFDTLNRNYPGYGNGISPDTIYVFDKVFCVSNGLWDNETIAVDLRVSPSLEGIIKLYSPSSTENRSPDEAGSTLITVIKPGEDACIGFVINTTGYTKDNSYEGTITIQGYRFT